MTTSQQTIYALDRALKNMRATILSNERDLERLRLELPDLERELAKVISQTPPSEVREIAVRPDMGFETGTVDGDKSLFMRPDERYAYSVPLVGGRRHGIYHSFFADGKIAIECRYQNGILNGRYKKFLGNGERTFEGSFNNGRLETIHYNKNDSF